MDVSLEKDLDKFIEQLWECKPLSESEVKFLCDKVRFTVHWKRYNVGFAFQPAA
jgi:hypothetical protein